MISRRAKPHGRRRLVTRLGGHFDKCIQHLFDAEVVDGTAEKNGCLAPLQKIIHLKRICRTLNQLDITSQFIRLAAQEVHPRWDPRDPESQSPEVRAYPCRA